MSIFKPFVVAFALAAMLVTATPKLIAQTPNDVLNPSNDDGTDASGNPIPNRDPIPEFIPGLIRPEDRLNTVFPGLEPVIDAGMISFDSVIDPFGRANPTQNTDLDFFREADFTQLTAGVQSIIRNHLIAQQQVQSAINFLEARREEILAGRNTQFNAVFGNIAARRRVAILAPNPLSGTVDASSGGFVLDGDDPFPAFPFQLRPGDWIFVGDPNPQQIAGQVVQVLRVDVDDDGGGGQGGGGGGGGGGDNQTIIIAPTTTGITTMLPSNVRIFRVIGFDNRADPARYDQVLDTFRAIREALAGFNPALPRLDQTPHNIRYQRDFLPIGPVGGSGGTQGLAPAFAAGDSPFISLNPFVANPNGADRLTRQAGFSNSDSHANLDRIYDISEGNGLDRDGNPTVNALGNNLPLLWTEDNQLPESFGSRISFGTNDDRAFFRDRQTIFGRQDFAEAALDFEFFIGRAFLEESIRHTSDANDFFASLPSIQNTLTQGIRRVRDPAGGKLVCPPADRSPACFEAAQIAETGIPTTRSTVFRRWQMIIEAFAEHHSVFTGSSLANKTAAIGILNLVGGAGNLALRAKDASSYARFAALIGGIGSDTSGIDRSRLEPRNRRASAGFFPVVPRN